MNKHEENPNGKLRTVQGVMSETNLSRCAVMQIAKASDSIYRFGEKIVRIDFEKFMQFFKEKQNATP